MIVIKRRKFIKIEKVCSRCKRSLPYWCFSKSKTGKGGFRSLCKECSTDAVYKRLYGITLKEARILLKEQDNQCALCDEPLELPSKSAHIDHDHRTGRIRGVLCRQCNTALGKLGDTIEKLEEVVRYLKGC